MNPPHLDDLTPAAPTHQEVSRKLVAMIPEALLESLRSACAAKAKFSLLGRIQGKHLGLKALTIWARETLHPSYSLVSLKNNNLFKGYLQTTTGED